MNSRIGLKLKVTVISQKDTYTLLTVFVVPSYLKAFKESTGLFGMYSKIWYDTMKIVIAQCELQNV